MVPCESPLSFFRVKLQVLGGFSWKTTALCGWRCFLSSIQSSLVTSWLCHAVFFLLPAPKACWFLLAAVQEERQRGKERGENEVESTSSFNEEMPVDKILDAELAVEPKTETYSDGSPSNSVRVARRRPKVSCEVTQCSWARRLPADVQLNGGMWSEKCGISESELILAGRKRFMILVLAW